jgi:site-specific recombinase XerC
MTASHPCPRQAKQLDAGAFQLEISSFALYLAAEGKSPRTIRTYTEAAAWSAAAHLRERSGRTSWEQAGKRDVQEWMVHLLGRYSAAYASNQYRGLQQFFKWLAAEEKIPDPMAGLHPPKVPAKLVPVFSDSELAALERACAGRGFAQRRDAAVIGVFRATGVRLSELAGMRYSPGCPPARAGDVDLIAREIIFNGKGRKPRTVKMDRDAARSLDRYLRVRSRHAQAGCAQLWLGVNGRGPLTASGIYQIIARRGEQAGWRCTRTGSGIISAIPGWTGAARRGT